MCKLISSVSLFVLNKANTNKTTLWVWVGVTSNRDSQRFNASFFSL